MIVHVVLITLLHNTLTVPVANVSDTLEKTQSYLQQNNTAWAQRTLHLHLQKQPENCEVRSWLAWLMITQGEFKLAQSVLQHPTCPKNIADRYRWQLFNIYILMHANKHDMAVKTWHTMQKKHNKQLYPEDLQLWSKLHGDLYPNKTNPLFIKFDLETGYTSNAIAGSPTDSTQQATASALGRIQIQSRISFPITDSVAPVLKLGLKSHGIADQQAQELSYFEPDAFIGIDISGKIPLTMGYRGSLLFLNQSQQSLFYEAHRFEFEMETPYVTLFTGIGKRMFREMGRTRFEIDGGVGSITAFSHGMKFMFANSIRYYKSQSGVYDLIGNTSLLKLHLPVSAFSFRFGVTLALDYYYNTIADKSVIAFGIDDNRFDALMRLPVEFYTPSWHGFRIGLVYNYAYRYTTADDETMDFTYQEQRILIKVVWSGQTNPWKPSQYNQKNHIELPYSFSKKNDAFDSERIQDLLQQDESMRRSSSCVQ